MISREDFAFTIGYDGAHAIIDGKARGQYGRLGTMELAEKGLYRAAFSSALWTATATEGPKDEGEMRQFIELYNKRAGTSYAKAEDMQRLFGVAIEEIKKVLAL